MGPEEVLRGMLMYFVLPLWLAAGFADYLCHRAAHIAEMAIPVLAALLLRNYLRRDSGHDRVSDTS
jgi:hypothetical protein